MRSLGPWLVPLSLASSAGCNQIFQLKDPAEQDAPPPGEAGEGPGIDAPVSRPLPITQLAYDNLDGSSLVVDSATPLAIDPMARVGLLDDPPMLPADPLPYGADGTVQVPRAFDGKDWRLVATVDGQLQEWQWHVADGAHVTSEVVARNPAKPTVPAGSAFRFEIDAPFVGNYTNLVVHTTGGWNRDHILRGSGGTAPYDWAPPAGSIAPTTAHHDVELLFSLKTSAPDSSGCVPPEAVGAKSVDLVAGQPSAPATAWNTTATSTWTVPTLVAASNGGSRFAALGGRYTSGTAEEKLHQPGYVVRGGIPSFSLYANDLGVPAVRHPRMIDLMSCRNYATVKDEPFVEPPASANLDGTMDRAWYFERSTTRSVGATSLTVTSVLQAINKVAATGPTTVTFATPLPLGVKLDAGASGELDLESGDFNKTLVLGATPRFIPLSWHYEGGTGIAGAPDDVTVIVYAITSSLGSQLKVVRTIHVTGMEAKLDSAMFQVGGGVTGYILEIIGHNGTDGTKIKNGDYTGATYPLSAASVFTNAFYVSNT